MSACTKTKQHQEQYRSVADSVICLYSTTLPVTNAPVIDIHTTDTLECNGERTRMAPAICFPPTTHFHLPTFSRAAVSGSVPTPKSTGKQSSLSRHLPTAVGQGTAVPARTS
ncbi:hypothetical protein CONLIGDRAFT_628414 [Coniochaeta ligniaria NRRL 30616]|uniref:Uncharacterized protein n=1 Tax=Coniochaeta ligniaria NRRL 30616 TaxID=1408157 RepID=A0A1J7J0C1_9PEZI|nr:hypothetical protein CONLIGDRAFT_628414 [Coniochaeta ligniaria NRRL 30616]